MKTGSGADLEATSRGRKEEEWQTQKTRSDGKPTEIHGQEKKSSRVEAATPTVVMTDVTRAPVIRMNHVTMSLLTSF